MLLATDFCLGSPEARVRLPAMLRYRYSLMGDSRLVDFRLCHHLHHGTRMRIANLLNRRLRFPRIHQRDWMARRRGLASGSSASRARVDGL